MPRQGNNGNHGKKGKSGRKARSVEEEAVLAFRRVVTPEIVETMSKDIVELFHRDADEIEEIDGGKTKMVRRASDPLLRFKIWTMVLAYMLGQPTQRVETGGIGDLQDYLAELMSDEQTQGDTEADSRNIQASWIQAETSD